MAVSTHNDPLLELLAEAGALTDAQVEEALEEQRRAGHAHPQDCAGYGRALTEDDLLVLIANHMGATMVNLADLEIPEIAKSIPASVARMYNGAGQL